MSHKLTQQNFYHGQSVLPDNLNQIQYLASEGLEHIVSNLLGFGIVSGFEIAFDDTNKTINVSKGLAFAQNGELLQLSAHKSVSLPNEEELQDHEILHLKLGIKKTFSDETPVTDDQNKQVFTTRTPDVEVILKENFDESYTVLANIEITVSLNNDNTKTVSCTINKTLRTITTLPQMFDKMYPIGYTYVQYPTTTGAFDVNQNPNEMFQGFGTWEMRFNDRGMFFRTEGGTAGEHRNSSNGTQPHAIQHHQHNTDISHNHTVSVYQHTGGNDQKGNGGYHNFSWRTHHTSYLSASRNSGNPINSNTSGETRPVNMLMRIWVKIS